MGFFKRKTNDVEPQADHAVITHLPFVSGADFGTEEEMRAVQDLEERIEEAAAAIGADHDGNEFGGGEAVLYSYGPDADKLFTVIRSCLDGFDVPPGSYAIKRYGGVNDADAKEVRVQL